MIADFSNVTQLFFGSSEMSAAYANGVKLWPAAVVGGYTPHLVDNGGTGNLTWGSIGSDSRYLSFSMLFNPSDVSSTVNSVARIGRALVNFQGNNIEFTAYNNLASLLVELNSGSILEVGTLYQLVVLCDMNAGFEHAEMYLNGVLVASATPDTLAMDHTRSSNGLIAGADFQQLGDAFIDLVTPGLTISDFWDGAPRDVSLVGAPGLLFNGNASDWATGTNFGNLTPTISVSGTFIDA